MQTNLIEENEELTDDQEPNKKDSKIDSTSSSLQSEEFKQPEVNIFTYKLYDFITILNMQYRKQLINMYGVLI